MEQVMGDGMGRQVRGQATDSVGEGLGSSCRRNGWFPSSTWDLDREALSGSGILGDPI